MAQVSGESIHVSAAAPAAEPVLPYRQRFCRALAMDPGKDMYQSHIDILRKKEGAKPQGILLQRIYSVLPACVSNRWANFLEGFNKIRLFNLPGLRSCFPTLAENLPDMSKVASWAKGTLILDGIFSCFKAGSDAVATYKATEGGPVRKTVKGAIAGVKSFIKSTITSASVLLGTVAIASSILRRCTIHGWVGTLITLGAGLVLGPVISRTLDWLVPSRPKEAPVATGQNTTTATEPEQGLPLPQSQGANTVVAGIMNQYKDIQRLAQSGDNPWLMPQAAFK